MKTKKYSHNEVYKLFKHWQDYSNVPINTLYNSLKRHGLQVIKVTESDSSRSIYNYIPEIQTFIKIR